MRSISTKRRSIFIAMIFLLLISVSPGVLAQLQGKKILMVIPLKDFWDEELTKLKEIFERDGLIVTIATSTMKEAVGMFGTTIKPDITLNKVADALYDAIVFVGGEGAVQYWDDTHAHRLVKEAFERGKVLGAISIAPIILANTKVLKGKRATVWPILKNRLKWEGAIYTGKPVEVDGKIVTADGFHSAEEFAKAILKTISQK